MSQSSKHRPVLPHGLRSTLSYARQDRRVLCGGNAHLTCVSNQAVRATRRSGKAIAARWVS